MNTSRSVPVTPGPRRNLPAWRRVDETFDWVPPMDLVEHPDRFDVIVDVPGVEAEALDVTLRRNVLSVEGERRRPAEDQDRRTTWHEQRSFGRFRRIVTLPDTIEPDGVHARLADGVLRLSIPKEKSSQLRRVEVMG